jgi:hypothetical protein
MSNQTPTRVNIQFSIELDELPREVSRLLEHSAEHVTAAAQGFNTIKNTPEVLTVSTWNQLDALRRSLSKADLVLDDLQKILGGYLQMQSEQLSVPQSPEPQSEEVGTPVDAMTERGIVGDHPDKNPRKSAREQKIAEAQNQLSAFMEQMHNLQTNPAATISAEEEEAMKTMKNRAQRVMETGNEESSGSKKPSV